LTGDAVEYGGSRAQPAGGFAAVGAPVSGPPAGTFPPPPGPAGTPATFAVPPQEGGPR
jgi:hypothetical protein